MTKKKRAADLAPDTPSNGKEFTTGTHLNTVEPDCAIVKLP